MKKMRDHRGNPVHTIVALGESTTWGYSVSDKCECWVNRVTKMIETYQGQEVRVINQGVGSNVLTPLCPAYEHSTMPSAMERLEEEVLRYTPDLLFLSYGLNDARAGTPVEVFRREYEKLLIRVKERCPQTMIILLNMYYMHECMYKECEEVCWNQGDYQVTDIFNHVLKQVAEKQNVILADIYEATKGVDWLVDKDHCHPNALGHQIIANRVFESLVRNSSFLTARIPETSNVFRFKEKYGNGPEIPAGSCEEKHLAIDCMQQLEQKQKGEGNETFRN